jgi:hypothetical protein
MDDEVGLGTSTAFKQSKYSRTDAEDLDLVGVKGAMPPFWEGSSLNPFSTWSVLRKSYIQHFHPLTS